MDFQEELVKYVFERLQGSHELDKKFPQSKGKPSSQYLLGNLACRRAEDDSGPEDTGRASIRAGRLRVSIPLVSVPSSDSEVNITVNGSVFFQGNKNGEKIWLRKDFSLAEKMQVALDSKPLDFSNVFESVNHNTDIVQKIPDSCWAAQLDSKIDKYEDQNIVRIDLTNIARQSTEYNLEHTLFNVNLEVKFVNLKAGEFCDQYDYEGFQQKIFYNFRTVNCQAKWIDSEKTRLVTRHFDLFRQPNILPKHSIEDVDFSFKSFSGEEGIASLNNILKAMNRHLEIYNSNAGSGKEGFMPREGSKQSTWEERYSKIGEFEETINLFERGIKVLSEDENSFLAFQKMNGTFNEYWTNKLAESDITPSWRLFQIIFIVCSLRSVVKNEELDVVDVLHVMTGGGKSEAYFGLVIFTMFFERLTGKKTGVTAIVKFPLRMLSIQQLERLAGIVLYSEKIRLKHEENFMGDPFSLGFFVGGSQSEDFPNYFYLLRDKLRQNRNDTISYVIPECPLCEARQRGKMLLKLDESSKRVEHICNLNPEHKGYIYLSDREIYHWRPTILVSTVDKWAGLAGQRRAGVLLGGKGSMCPDGHGFIPLGDCCENLTKEIKCSHTGLLDESLSGLGPCLSIQDEAHLLKEGFGTINSHFESLIENLVEANCGHKLKHITMSATLRGTKVQNNELYNKDSVIIPGPSPEGEGTSEDFFYINKGNSKRLIYGVKPNLKDNHLACLRNLNFAFEFLKNCMKEIDENAENFANKYNLHDGDNSAIETIKQHISHLTYHHKVQDAIEMARMSYAELDNWNLDGQKVLIGGSTLEELKETIDDVRSTVKNFNLKDQIENGPFFGPVHATSVVSHGIDIEEWNFMLFQGIPHSTAEYIQALSRVGRKQRGIVIVWFYPNRVRDDSFYSNFGRFHEVLDHEVKPVPINRIARLGVLQTVNSIFCAGVMHYLSNKLDKPVYTRAHLNSIKDEEIWDDFKEFIAKVYGRTLDDVNLSTEIDDRRLWLRTNTESTDKDLITKSLGKHPNQYYRTQTGMRGIQKELVLQPWSQTGRIVNSMED